MNRLPLDAYPCLRPLFQEPHLSFVVEAMIAGNSPALVWADQPDEPHTVLIWDNAHCLYLAGDTDNTALNEAVFQLLIEHILPQGRARRLGIFKLYTASTAWKQKFDTVSGCVPSLAHRERVLFTLPDSDAVHVSAPLPDEFRLERITTELLAADLENVSDLADEIDSCWSSRERFFQHGIGCCAVRQAREIAGWCTTEYSSDGQCGIGVETIEAYTNQGIATRVARAVLDECRRRQVRPHWDSWLSNQPSIVVAEKLGCQETLRYSVWLGQF